MISVQNHRQLLSGNNLFFILAFILFLGLTSCGGTKEVVKPRKDKDVTEVSKKPERDKNQPVDTIIWNEVPEEKAPPIISSDKPTIDKKEEYHITVALPFKTKEFSTLGRDHRFIEFYAGFQMGIDELLESGLNIKIKTIDTEGNGEITKDKLVNVDTDLLVGGYERSTLTELARWAKDRKIPMVSPWVASRRITSENPYYIQLRPDVRAHYHAIIQNILKDYNADQVTILKKNDGSDDNKVRYIQEYAAGVLGEDGHLPFREFAIEEDSLILGEAYMMNLFSADETSVFISQNYLFEEDDFVYNTLRKLNAAKGYNKAVVYGMPLLIDMDKIDYSLFKMLNIHVARSRFIDIYADDIKDFKADFFATFQTLPSEDAYLGYDVAYFFGKMLDKYGSEFSFFLDQEEKTILLGTRFDIQKNYVGDRVSDDFRDINFYMNNYLDIIKFVDDRFIVERD